MTAMGDLIVLVDGAPLPGEDARAFWRRFSDWMNEHPGDLAGFAQAEGMASVRPEIHEGTPALVASRTAAQTPYASAPKRKDAPPGGARTGSPNTAKGPRAAPFGASFGAPKGLRPTARDMPKGPRPGGSGRGSRGR